MHSKIVRKNSEWPKMAIPNFFQQFFQEDCYKLGMAKTGYSEFFLTILPKKTGINSEWSKCAFQIYLNLFATKRLEEILNGQN